ncbi:hypothetical protein AQJ66_06045 [Streptomyces bungoensis]|uniref:Uncharacterized protein n=1 Tax=Streptomyces bungoensis TaxID=285568 RepID=A0A124I569_9ACTN|nr:hypothetical protein AQJ66_06045 [Streptomyces bungoensis]
MDGAEGSGAGSGEGAEAGVAAADLVLGFELEVAVVVGREGGDLTPGRAREGRLRLPRHPGRAR